MKNVLLFGSGNGAKEYLLKNKDANILAIFDNDIKKHGLVFEGITIHHPKDIKNFIFDEIIIVSQWAKDIYEQLDELGVSKEKIYIPAKKDIKYTERPFEDSKTIELARKIIKHISYYAFKDNIPVLVDFGTLLGIVRDGDVIEWDDDVDFSITDDVHKVDFSLWISEVVKKIEEPIKISIRSKIINNVNVSYILEFVNTNEDIRFKNFIISISLRKNIENNSIHLPSGGMWYAPQKHFLKYEVLEWNGQNIFVPYDYENYLTFLYGDWKVPKKDITMTDYANLGKVEYNEFIDLGIGYKEIK